MFNDGKRQRMDILVQNYEGRISELLDEHSWQHQIDKEEEDGEYLLIAITKNNIHKKFALLYSQSTNKTVYERIEKEADACIINGFGFDKNNFFSKDFTKPIMSAENLLSVLRDWNHEADLFNVSADDDVIDHSIPDIEHLQAENASEQVWMMIKALKSVEVCNKYLMKKYTNVNESELKERAQGIAFLIQNACDYFDKSSSTNFTQHLLNLYYGSLSFVEAELLANSKDYSSLEQVESITKHGHGLYTILSEVNYNPDNLYTGILGKNKGLFPTFLENRGYNIDNFPPRKHDIKDLPCENCFSLNCILNRIPEISNLMRIIDSDYKPGFFNIYYDISSNRDGSIFCEKDGCYKSSITGSYVGLTDFSKCGNLEFLKLLQGPFEQFEYKGIEDNAKRYSAFIRHECGKDKHWYNYVNIHKSSFCDNSIIIPLKNLGDEWDIYVIMVLYTLSIVVRYYPNLWRRMQIGEWDKYYPVFQQFALVVEKILPNIFYEKITGQKLYVHQAGIF